VVRHTSESVTVKVPGKINLALRVGDLADDGFHPLVTVFQAVSVFDHVTVRPAPLREFTVEVGGAQTAGVPTDVNNIAIRAVRSLGVMLGGAPTGIHLTLHKQIPVAGGMAGGSADAAGALLAAATLWQMDLSTNELCAVAATLGADVPFSLVGGTAVGTGRGDRLAPALSRGTYHWVLGLSRAQLSTPGVYRRFDELDAPKAPLGVPDGLMNALAAGDAEALGPHLVNDLQPAAIDIVPELEHTLRTGRSLGACGALVSGSGPTVAFLAKDEGSADDIADELRATTLCESVLRVTGPVPGARVVHPEMVPG
jgi:4-diphosphocytidyl-2-C-methyl-D-erythritol kinase